MLPCEDVRNLIEQHLAGALPEPVRREFVAHVKTCSQCHRALEEARLANMVLSELHAPAPPPALATQIKQAACLRLAHPPRPLHQRVLGSPAFLATSASILCGAIICLIAIIRLGSVSPEAHAPSPLLVSTPQGHTALVPPPVQTVLRRPLPPRRLAMARRAHTGDAHLARMPRHLSSRFPSRPVPHVAAARRGVSSARGRPAGAPTPSGVARPVMLAAAGPSVLPEIPVRPAGVRTSLPGSVLEAPRTTGPVRVEPASDVHLMDLIAAPPADRAEFIRMDP